MNLPRSDPRRSAFANREASFRLHGTILAAAPPRQETAPVWEEAGIAPSLRTRLVVELFHRLAMGEEAEAAALARALARAPGDDAPCLVVDPAGLRRAARDLGIRTAGRADEVIASAVVEAVIDEYTPRHSTTPE